MARPATTAPGAAAPVVVVGSALSTVVDISDSVLEASVVDIVVVMAAVSVVMAVVSVDMAVVSVDMAIELVLVAVADSEVDMLEVIMVWLGMELSKTPP